MSDFSVPQSSPSKFPYTTIVSTLPYDFSTAWIMQPDKPVVNSVSVKDPESPEQSMAIRARSDSNSFGALQFNFEREDWAHGYVIEDTGIINTSDHEWEEGLLPFESNMNSKWAANIAGNQGLTAGKLYLNSQLLVPTGSDVDVQFVCSGFCFEQRFFITTRHFSPSDSAALEKMFRVDHAQEIAKISIDRYSPDVTGARRSRSAYLAYESIELDMAIFALSDSEPSWPTYVRFSQLLATDKINYSLAFAGQKAFSVGYATNEDQRYPQYWQTYYSMLQNNRVPKTMSNTQNQLQPPNFQEIFHPCERILMLGKLDTIPPQNSSVWRHYIPGWFGMSGSLIGVLNDNMGQDQGVDVYIMGMFKGGEPDEPANQLVPFTTKLIDIISRICSGQNGQGN